MTRLRSGHAGDRQTRIAGIQADDPDGSQCKSRFGAIIIRRLKRWKSFIV
jgi:hypothetical protein